MDGKKILIDDWNIVFRNIPKEINRGTFEVLSSSNSYFNFGEYHKFKNNIKDIIGDVGEFEIINYLSGDQAIQQAIMICKKYLDINKIISVSEAYHGITFGLAKNNKITYDDIDILEFSLKSPDFSIDNYLEEKTLLILEPLLFFAEKGEKGIKQIKEICNKAKKKNCIILFDEVRSGVFSTGTFLFTQQMTETKPDIVCFAKGLALGVATSVVALDKKTFSNVDISKEDVLKSNLSISDIAMQRSNALIRYYKRNEEHFNNLLSTTSEKISNFFEKTKKDSCIDEIHIKGLCCIIVFSHRLKKRKLNIIRQYMLTQNLSVRHLEENILYINFAVDSSNEEINMVCNVVQKALALINGRG